MSWHPPRSVRHSLMSRQLLPSPALLSPLKPGLHAQLQLPSVFVQFACSREPSPHPPFGVVICGWRSRAFVQMVQARIRSHAPRHPSQPHFDGQVKRLRLLLALSTVTTWQRARPKNI